MRRFGLLLSLILSSYTFSKAFAENQNPRKITINAKENGQILDRFYNLSIGADYPGTLIRDENQTQLAVVSKELGFRYIRFHAIFHDDLKTVKLENGKISYDWSKIDELYDKLLAKNIKPFVELGFTPDALKTSNNSIFYWKGNTSHPKPKAWHDLVTAFVEHLESRYGKEEVQTWFFEVWNEPNLDGFWENADKAEYLSLYANSADAIKKVDKKLRVGGPSTAGAAWVPEFLNYCYEANTPVDFVTTHTYGVESGFLDENGKDDTKLSPSNDGIIGDVIKVRGEISASKYPKLPLYFTEWSTSYSPRDLVHDSYISASYVLDKLKRSKGIAQGMSYWTFTDLFEEPGPADTAFHGGFGLMTIDGIKKPTYFAYKYLNELSGREVNTNDEASIATVSDSEFSVLLWDYKTPQQKISNRSYYGKLLPSTKLEPISLNFKNLEIGKYEVNIFKTGFDKNDPYSAYLRMGSPKELTHSQIRTLKTITADKPNKLSFSIRSKAGNIQLNIPLNTYDIALIKIRKSK